MSLVTLPKAGMPVVGNLPMSREWYRWANDITQRVGGVTGSSNDELALSQFEDAGIEEAKAAIYRVADETGIAPLPQQEQVDQLTAQVNHLREELAALAQIIQDLQQGTSL